MKILTKVRKMGDRYYIPIPSDENVTEFLNKDVFVAIKEVS